MRSPAGSHGYFQLTDLLELQGPSATQSWVNSKIKTWGEASQFNSYLSDILSINEQPFVKCAHMWKSTKSNIKFNNNDLKDS